MTVSAVTTGRPPGPADRLLDAAVTLFAQHGIRAVGIDQVLRSANVARASLYQNYGSKDGLVTAYLRHLDDRDRTAYAAAAQDLADPTDRILLVFDLAASSAPRRNFRGCLYLNAATEFPDPQHPSAAVIRDHRAWLAAMWREELVRLGAIDPDSTVAELTLLYDGALAQSKVARNVEPIRTARRLARERLEACAA